MVRSVLRGTALVAVAACVACSSSESLDVRDPFESEAERDARAISLWATNDYAEDVILYVITAGRMERVGTVAPERSRRFRVPWEGAGVQEVRVRIEILAGPRYTTNPVSTVFPGDRIEVYVRPTVERSFIRKR